MARASYIYMAVNADSRCWPVEAAFTVKHELVTWIGQQEDQLEGSDIHVIRVPDGKSATHDMFEGAPYAHDFWKDNK